MSVNGAYDAWLLWWPTYACNLRCSYCYFAANRGATAVAPDPIQVERVAKALAATGLVFKLSLSGGGDPFMVPNIVEASVELAKKHFLSFNTNLTSPRVATFAEAVDPARCDFIHASCHVEELERTGLLSRYVSNYHLLREKGFVVHCCEVAHPSLLPEMDRYRESLAALGLPLTFCFFVGEHQGRQYPQSYTREEADRIRRPPLVPAVLQRSLQDYVPKKYELPELADDLYNVILSPRNKLCNAGYNAGFVAGDGIVRRCLSIPDELGHIYDEIRFEEQPLICSVEFCVCPLKSYDIYLRDLAADEYLRRRALRPPQAPQRAAPWE